MKDLPKIPYTQEQSRVKKKRLKLRQVAYNKRQSSDKNYLKLLYHVFLDAEYNYNLSPRQLMMLFYCNDMEFFTTEFALKHYNITSKKYDFQYRVLSPLYKGGYIYKYFNSRMAGLPKELQQNYTTRWALTACARQLVNNYYRKLDGQLPIFIDRDKYEMAHREKMKKMGGTP